MQSKLFLIYLRYRNPFLFFFVTLTLIICSLNQYLEYKSKNANYEPWIVTNVLSGDTLTVARDNENKTIKLCGIVAGGDKARDYLQSLIAQSNEIIELEKVDNSYEAWILLDSEIEQQIHLNTHLIETKNATLANHKNCLSGENLEFALNL